MDERIARREFLRRAAGAGATVVAATAAGVGLHVDPGEDAGRRPDDEDAPSARAWDFRVRDDGPRLAIASGMDRARGAERLLAALGGAGRFVRPGDRVALKVNAGFATPPQTGATVHPDLLAAVVRLCRDAGARDVFVVDNPVNDPESTFRVTGLGAAAEAAGARVVLPRPDQFRPLDLPGGELIRDWPVLCGPLDAADKVIGIAPVKDHGLGGATLSIKNGYGWLGGRRNLFHQRMQDILVELAQLVRPTLVLLDGTWSMVRNGPTGGSDDDLRPTATMAASVDPVAADAFGVTLLGRTAAEFPWMARAAAATGGTADWASLRPLRVEA